MEDNQEGNRGWWRFFDGSASVSASMLLSVLLRRCVLCENLPVLGFLKTLTNEESGVIIMATLLLFPTTLTLYGGAQLIFAAKEAVEKRARMKGRAEGRAEAEAETRKQVLTELEKRGLLTPEIAKVIDEQQESSE